MNFDISSLVDGLDFSTNHFVDAGNGLMLTNGEISVLKRFGINYLKCSSLKEILYQIDVVLKEDEEVYLTKNGYGTMVVMSLEKYSKLMSEVEYNQYVENALDEAEEEAKIQI